MKRKYNRRIMFRVALMIFTFIMLVVCILTKWNNDIFSKISGIILIILVSVSLIINIKELKITKL